MTELQKTPTIRHHFIGLLAILGVLCASACIKAVPKGKVSENISASIASEEIPFVTSLKISEITTFSDETRLAYARARATVNLIDDDHILVSGGSADAKMENAPYDNVSPQAFAPAAEYYIPSTGLFQPGPNHKFPRAGHTATLLLDQSVILIGGVSWKKRDVATSEFLARGENIWQEGASLNTARQNHTSSLLPDGRILVAGGIRDSLTPLSSSEIYDPTKKTFSPGPFLRTERAYHTATTLADGRILLIGGVQAWSTSGASRSTYPVSGTAEIFDPVLGTFKNVLQPMITPRWSHSAVLLKDGRVLVAGGRIEAPSQLVSNTNEIYWTLNTHTTAKVEIFNPADESWTEMPDMSINRVNFSLTPIQGGLILAAGGSVSPYVPQSPTQIASAEIFDLTSSKWTLTQKLYLGRSEHLAVPLPSGKVVLLTGRGGDDINPGATATLSYAIGAAIFDPSTLGWTKPQQEPNRLSESSLVVLKSGEIFQFGSRAKSGQGSIYDPATGATRLIGGPGPRMWQTAHLLPNAQVMVVGGIDATPSASDSPSYFYNPTDSKWTPAPSPHLYRGRHAGVSLRDGRILVAGSNDSVSNRTSEIYDPVQSTWKPTANLLHARGYASAILLKGGNVLLAGGINFDAANQDDPSCELFDPSTETWQATGAFSIPRQHPSLVLMNDGKVLAVGGSGYSPSRTVELFDPTTGRWSLAKSMSEDRFDPAATLLLDGRILVTGGGADLSLGLSAEIYDPKLNTWSTVNTGSSVLQQNAPSVALLQDGRVYAGFGRGPNGDALGGGLISLFEVIRLAAEGGVAPYTLTVLSGPAKAYSPSLTIVPMGSELITLSLTDAEGSTLKFQVRPQSP